MSFASPHFSKLKRSVSLLSDLDDNLIVVKGKSYRKLTLLGKGGSCKVGNRKRTIVCNFWSEICNFHVNLAIYAFAKEKYN